jgi:hypothetical protein
MPVLRIEAIDQVPEWTHFAGVLQAANPADRSFYTQTEAAVRHTAVFAQYDVPLIRFHRQTVIVNVRDQQIGIGHALGTADDFTVPPSQQDDTIARSPSVSHSMY